MQELLRHRIARLVGHAPRSWRRVHGGYTPAERWQVCFRDAPSVFVKVGATPLTADFLRVEARRYSEIQGDFMPRLLGFDDDSDRPLLVIEDLSHARWPPPWHPNDIERLREALACVARTRPLPDDLPQLSKALGVGKGADGEELLGWNEVARDRAAFLSLGLCTDAWLSRALPRLIEAQRHALLDGDDLLHGDVRSDNVCFRDDRAVLVDWNVASRGAAPFDEAFAAPSLRLEGGPLPEEFVGADPSLAAVVSGYFAERAGLAPIPDAPRVRWIQTRQLRVALPWVARTLELPPPDLPWGRDAVARIDALHREGAIDEQAWHEQIEEVIGDAYLASNDPRAQSGKSGDEADWRWARELLLDALPGGGSVLDVGCANGYLLESIERWAAERGIAVEPFGLDISWRLVELARRRLPHLAARIWVGNAADWTPPRRFDLVHTGLDYIPEPRRKGYLTRLLRDLVTPNGRLVMRPERVVAGQPDLAEQITRLGFEVDAVLDRRHPVSGQLRRSVVVSARRG